MSHQVIFRPAADQDIDSAYAWYEQQQAGLGDQFLRSVDVTIEHIRANPLLYPVVRGTIHRAVLSRFPYLLFYLVERERVVVIGCMHASRDPRRWPS